ncbi:MAG: alpha/beta fold hydrolase [Mycobacterium sp.]
MPTLVIECAVDAIAPREVGADAHEHIADSQLITLDATGHCPFAESHAPAMASAIVEAVQALLEGLGSGVQDDVAVLALGVPSATERETR